MHSSADYYLQRIEGHAIAPYWDAVAPSMQRAIDELDEPYRVDEIKQEVEKNNMQLWVVFSRGGKVLSSFVTTLVDNRERLIIFYGGGREMSEWLHLFNDLMRWGKDNGCKYCEVHGRLGWEKVLRPYGFERKKIILQKSL